MNSLENLLQIVEEELKRRREEEILKLQFTTTTTTTTKPKLSAAKFYEVNSDLTKVCLFFP